MGRAIAGLPDLFDTGVHINRAGRVEIAARVLGKAMPLEDSRDRVGGIGQLLVGIEPSRLAEFARLVLDLEQRGSFRRLRHFGIFVAGVALVARLAPLVAGCGTRGDRELAEFGRASRLDDFERGRVDARVVHQRNLGGERFVPAHATSFLDHLAVATAD